VLLLKVIHFGMEHNMFKEVLMVVQEIQQDLLDIMEVEAEEQVLQHWDVKEGMED
jgi:hypothetical protein